MSTGASRNGTNGDGRPSAEEAQLDDALGKADEILVQSLHAEDQRRRRRALVLLVTVGGLVVIAAVAMFAVLGVMGSDDRAAAELATEGWRLWGAQQYEQALDKFTEATKLAPDDANAWNGLGWARFNGGDASAAKEAFERAVELAPDHPAAQNGLGQIALADRDYTAAEPHLLKAAPQAPAAWYGLSRLYLIQGQYDDASRWLKKIVDPGADDPLVARLLAAAEAKDLPDELRTMIEPPLASPHAKKVAEGWRLMNGGQPAEARQAFEELLADDAKDADALNGLGWLSLSEGDTAVAKEYFERTLKAEPAAFGAMNGLARALYAQGDKQGAVGVWRKMIEKLPGPHAGSAGLAELYMELEQYQDAVPLLEQLHEAHPDNEQIARQLERAGEKAAEKQ